jgi:hypothetical protein
LNVKRPQVSSFGSSARRFHTRVVRTKKERWWVVVLHLGTMNLVTVLVEDLVGLEVRMVGIKG